MAAICPQDEFRRKNNTEIVLIMDDAALLDLANLENRVLLTNDKDFGELVFLQKKVARGIILLRVKGENTQEKVQLMEKLILSHHSRILNHFILITSSKFRFIPMEDIIP